MTLLMDTPPMRSAPATRRARSMSALHTEPVSPNGVSFARSMASRSELKLSTGITGPKVSSVTTSASSGTSTSRIGGISAERPSQSWPVSWRAPRASAS